LLEGIGGWSEKNIFFTFIFFWVVGRKKALKKNEIGLSLLHYFYYQPVIIQMIINLFLRLLIFFIRENQSKNLVRFGHNNLFNAFIQP
jgi:hypothetical protein